MHFLKSILGTVAVIFSIQPLAAWAAQDCASGDAGKSSANAIQIQIKSAPTSRTPEGGGNPTCHTC
jgi:hypothetical protein